MRINNGLRYMLLGTFLILAGHPIFGQDEWEEAGEIEDAQVIIEKDRTIILPTASRPYEKIPPPDYPKGSKPQQYNFDENVYEGAFYTPKVTPQSLVPKSAPAPLNNYIKAGFGNYLSPLAEGSVNIFQNKFSAGLNFKHLSFARGPVDGKNSATSDNNANVYSTFSTAKNTLSLGLNFSSVKRFHYGYDQGSSPSTQPTKQRYHNFGAVVSLQNARVESPVDYAFRAGFYTFSDNFNAKETAVISRIQLRKPLTEAIEVFADFNLLLSQYQDITSLNRNIINIKSGAAYERGALSVSAAANIAITNDTISNSNDFKLYPYLQASYQLAGNWTVYSGFIGELNAVTLKSIATENPFIASNIGLSHSNKRFEVYGKVNGMIIPNFIVNTGLSFTNYENLYTYTNTLRFDLTYEQDATNRLNLFAEFSYRNNKIIASTRFDYFDYSTKTITEAWHRPGFTSTCTLRYQYNDALSFGTTLTILGNIPALNSRDNSTVTLDPIVDLGIDARYQINDQFSGFLALDNVLSRKYERYFNYVNRSFMGHAGIIFSF